MSDIPKSQVQESCEYDNLLSLRESVDHPRAFSLLDFIDLTEEEKKQLAAVEEKEWKKHWKGMPEFEQEGDKPYRMIYVRFRNKEDFEEFSQLVDQKLTDKTKSIWYPKLDIAKNSLLRWVEE